MEQMIANMLPWLLVGVLIGGAYLFGSIKQEMQQEKVIKAVMDFHREELERAHQEGIEAAIRDMTGSMQGELDKARKEGWDDGFNAGYDEATDDRLDEEDGA